MWITYAITCAILNATGGALTKRVAERTGALAATFGSVLFTLPLAVVALAVTGVPAVERSFWPAFVIGLAANIVALTLRNLGLRLAPLSLAVPFLSFTPVFLLITETLVLGDRPPPAGVAGIVAIVVGAYMLQLEAVRTGWLAPLRAIASQRGVVLMLVVAVIWSVTSVIDKVCVLASSPVFYMAAFHIGFTIGYLPILALRRTRVTRALTSNWRMFALIGALHFGSLLAQMMAIELTLVSYVISIKRAGMLVSVLIGVFFFGERGLRQRLAGAALMSAGVAMILVS